VKLEDSKMLYGQYAQEIPAAIHFYDILLPAHICKIHFTSVTSLKDT